MKTFFTAIACVLIFFTAASTGHAGKKSRKSDRVRKNEIFVGHLIRQVEEIANAFEMVRNKRSARLAAKRIDKSLDRLIELNAAQNTIPKLSQKQIRALEKKYSPKLEAAIKRMKSSAATAGKNSGGEKSFVKTMQRMISVGHKLQTSSILGEQTLKKLKAKNKKERTNRGSTTRRGLKSRKIRKRKRYRRKRVEKNHKKSDRKPNKKPARKKRSTSTH